MSLRHVNGQICDARPRRATGVDVFEPSVPWRTFPRRHGQKQYSGTYWSSAMRDRVVSKSRFGLTCLLHADFDQDVTAVFARLGWAREVAVSRGWDFEVWCEPPEAELAKPALPRRLPPRLALRQGPARRDLGGRPVRAPLGEAFRLRAACCTGRRAPCARDLPKARARPVICTVALDDQRDSARPHHPGGAVMDLRPYAGGGGHGGGGGPARWRDPPPGRSLPVVPCPRRCDRLVRPGPPHLLVLLTQVIDPAVAHVQPDSDRRD